MSPVQILECFAAAAAYYADGFCQPILDFRCDPDCIDGKGDTDCLYIGNPLMAVMAMLVILVIIGGIVWFFLKKKKT